MKKTTRLLIELKRRQVTITLRQSPDIGASAENIAQPLAEAPVACPVCGCSSLISLSGTILRDLGSQADLSQALEAGEIHLATAGSEAWLCETSFEKFRDEGKEVKG